VAVTCACWAGLFAANYLAFLRPLVRHEGLLAYWSAGYIPHDRTAVVWLGGALHRIYTDYGSMWLPLPDVAVLATVLGLVWLWRHNRLVLAVCTLPVLAALTAAGLHRFPFSDRLVLFLVPLVVLLIGAGAQAVFDAILPGRRCVAVVMLLLLLGPTAVRASYYVAVPHHREELKPVLAFVRDRAQPGDVMYVFDLSAVPLRYYRDRFGLGPDIFNLARTRCVFGKHVEPTEDAYAAELGPLRGNARVWVLLSHTGALGGPDEGKIISAVLDRMGRRLDEHRARGARVLLYDLTPAPATAPAPIARG
jgi:hypothetical protein